MAEKIDRAKAPDAFVKGGTTSSKWDMEKQKQYAQSADGRQQMDRWGRAVRTGEFQAGPNDAVEKGAKAMVASLRLEQEASPKLLLRYKTGDRSVFQEVLSELVVGLRDESTGEATDSAFVMLCMKCHSRGGRQDDSQLIVRRSHRHFDVKPFTAGSLESLYVNPKTGAVYNIVGAVTAQDVLTCTALGCGAKYRIDESVVYTL